MLLIQNHHEPYDDVGETLFGSGFFLLLSPLCVESPGSLDILLRKIVFYSVCVCMCYYKMRFMFDLSPVQMSNLIEVSS